MAQPRTAQQIADAAAKRRQTQAANRAAGIPTVRQARAAAKAAKAGQPYVPPAPKQPRPSNTSQSRRRRRHGYSAPAAPAKPAAPVFATPKPTYRPLQLVALAAIEDVFVVKLRDKGITPEARIAFEKYQKLKRLALGATNNVATQNEADSALRMAIVHLVQLAF
jgi:hypothetical protein